VSCRRQTSKKKRKEEGEGERFPDIRFYFRSLVQGGRKKEGEGGGAKNSAAPRQKGLSRKEKGREEKRKERRSLKQHTSY